jgi:DNA-binding NarL/FixJ family response regulator
MPARHKILIVDDHPVFREGLIRILNQVKEWQVVGEASGSADAMKLVGTLRPELAIIDFSLEGSNGIDLIRDVRSRHAEIRILMLSMHKESLYAERALRAGANGYIMKSESGARLVESIRQVLSGQTYVSETMKEALLQKLTGSSRDVSQAPEELLSDREFEIFQLIGQGYGTRQIADDLSLSIKTVESHREHIRDKMHLATTFELVQSAIHWMNSANR